MRKTSDEKYFRQEEQTKILHFNSYGFYGIFIRSAGLKHVTIDLIYRDSSDLAPNFLINISTQTINLIHVYGI